MAKPLWNFQVIAEKEELKALFWGRLPECLEDGILSVSVKTAGSECFLQQIVKKKKNNQNTNRK